MVEKVTTPEKKIATTISSDGRNSIFGHISPLVGRNNDSNRCPSPKNNNPMITNRSSRYVLINDVNSCKQMEYMS